MGDLCLELQKAAGKEKRCQYLPPMAEPGKLNDFRDRALVSLWSLAFVDGSRLSEVRFTGGCVRH
jgi:hypothetical protein